METATEARPSDTVEACRRRDMLSFSAPSPAHGHCSPKAVSRQKLSGTKAAWLAPSVTTAVGYDPKQLILAVGRIGNLFRPMVPS